MRAGSTGNKQYSYRGHGYQLAVVIYQCVLTIIIDNYYLFLYDFILMIIKIIIRYGRYFEIEVEL